MPDELSIVAGRRERLARLAAWIRRTNSELAHEAPGRFLDDGESAIGRIREATAAADDGALVGGDRVSGRIAPF